MRSALIWAVAGALTAFAIVAAASIGLFFTLPAAVALALAVRELRGWPAIGVGFGAIFLLVACLQRGPRNLDARPWFWSGVVACEAAALALLRRRK